MNELLFSGAGVLLSGLAVLISAIIIKWQIKEKKNDNVEKIVFEMLSFHYKIIDGIQLNPNNGNAKEYRGRDVFQYLYGEFIKYDSNKSNQDLISEYEAIYDKSMRFSIGNYF